MGLFRSCVLVVAVLMACAPKTAAQTPSPMGLAVHTIGADDNWQVDRWLPHAQQSRAGWVRDPVYFETFVFPDNPDGLFIPIPGHNPARWIDRAAIAGYANEAAKILEGGFYLTVCVWASMDPGDEDTTGPVMLELMDQLRLRLGTNAPKYLARLAIEHFNEANIYADGRPDIHIEPPLYVAIAAEIHTAMKSRAEYRHIPILVGATAHFGWDYVCGFDWSNGPVAAPPNPPARCARYTTAPYNTLSEFGLGWLTQILELGIIDYADGFSAHPYRGTSPPELGFSLFRPESDPEGFIDEIRLWVSRIEQFNSTGKPLVYQFTEIGYPSSPTVFGAGSQQRQGDYLTRLWTMLVHEALLARRKLDRGEPGGFRLTAFHYNTLKDDCVGEGPGNTLPCGGDVPDQEKTGGLLTWDLEPKIAFEYFTQLGTELRVDTLDGVELQGVSVTAASVPIYKRLFRRKDATGWVLAVWTGTPDTVSTDVDISLTLGGNYLSVRRTDLGAQGTSTVEVPFVRTGNGVVLQHVQLLNRVTFFKIQTAQATANDFDGDGKTDVVLWRPGDGTWRVLTSSSGYDAASAQVKQWGHAGDVPISGDFDGDGLADLAIWRPCDGFVPPCGGRWYWLTSSSGFDYAAQQSKQWGAPTDIPVPGDYDGDGKMDLAVWRPSTGTWFVLTSSTGYSYAAQQGRQWGAPTDIPVPGDYDGDGKTDLAVWRPGTGTWFGLTSSTGYDYGYQWGRQWGAPTDIPVPADFDGDGKTDLAVWRPGDGVWYWLVSSASYDYAAAHGVEWGIVDDVPVAADYDGDGYADLLIWRPSESLWYVLHSSTGYLYGTSVMQGVEGDLPPVTMSVPAARVPRSPSP